MAGPDLTFILFTIVFVFIFVLVFIYTLVESDPVVWRSSRLVYLMIVFRVVVHSLTLLSHAMVAQVAIRVLVKLILTDTQTPAGRRLPGNAS